MSSHRPVSIRNVTSIEQYVLIDGRRFSVGPFQIRVYEEPIARAFLERCAPRIVREGGISAVDEDRPRFDRVYLYNLSGNPDAPAEVPAVVFEEGRTINKMIPNPLKDATTVKRMLKGGEIQVSVKGEATSRRLPEREVYVHPWTRKVFEVPEADWMLNREGMKPRLAHMLGRSRPPTNFEPDESWEMDDILIYAGIIDPKMKRVPNEKKLRDLRPVNLRALVAELGDEVLAVRSGDEVVDRAKDLMLKRIYFRVANPMYNLPTREEFLSVKARGDGTEVVPKIESPKRGSASTMDLSAVLDSLPNEEGSNEEAST